MNVYIFYFQIVKREVRSRVLENMTCKYVNTKLIKSQHGSCYHFKNV
uniref:Uncharacterized protein n=1 Tax=Lepeophtheirus salmonis TaxID=72036 RepID=A0A0K2SYX3_LEPSM